MLESQRVELRPATAADAPIIAGLHTLGWQTAYRHILPDDYLFNDVPAEHRLRWSAYFARDAREWGFVKLAEQDGVPVGFVSAEKPVDETRGVLLDCLHLHPAHRGQGTGRRMIEEVRVWASGLPASRLHLLVLEDNARAIRFYERNGWQLLGTESCYLGKTLVADRVYTLPV
ncbi:GNAT family N-acetyltransferase [Trinickia caryophylli]|uniref:Protein N-acetyltransferase, RimJ/RimL family n=1 Tax=Trinickia caryophylli TaxID=28094 RepID=A0A1X7GHT6_TRICW|nr:GNAT family N-acetyltransferase [Trinickia caryophylli]PMS09839.1 N-acetyltransferase [Trinickia caryophylli]TRX14874.1 GNAT family N-acetyltransferase [Trinickia caryophylli]WQE14723.1 GNAT family N-acetyltransferase [Trinickia caryophylli]SMF69927.1 Protein N-acetyltransferase, RimJ/RimL family [Trinickia caryophylli]GLU34918.1 hypothetical protein Busp01_47600 [Trinickia caryophylli]